MKKIFNFKNQYVQGVKGEDLFIKSYIHFYPKKGDGKKTDIILNDGSKIELKTDFYSMKKTPNFFMEEFGNYEKKTIGGPKKSLLDGNNFFVYLYYPEKMFYWFLPKMLVNKINKLKKEGKAEQKFINNGSYITKGYLIERTLLFDCLFRMDMF
jgi:hypothetical protein